VLEPWLPAAPALDAAPQARHNNKAGKIVFMICFRGERRIGRCIISDLRGTLKQH
jgi:hypothetical protein